MSARQTYVLCCDDCGAVFHPSVGVLARGAESPAQIRSGPTDLICPHTLGEVRAAAAATGWTTQFHAPRFGMGWSSDRCAACSHACGVETKEG